MEQANKLVCLLVGQPVAATILHELKLAVDALADGGRRRLRQNHSRHALEFGRAGSVLVPPQVGGHLLGRVHDPVPREHALPAPEQGQLCVGGRTKLLNIRIARVRVVREVRPLLLRAGIGLDGGLPLLPLRRKLGLGPLELADLEQDC